MSQPPAGYPEPQPGFAPNAAPDAGYATPPGSGYPPPGNASPYGAYPPPVAPSPKKFRAGTIILISFAAILVLCLGGGTAVYFALKDEVKEATGATPTPTGSAAPSPSPSARISLVAPKTLDGRPRNNEPQLKSATDQMISGLQGSMPDATDAIAAFYGELDDADLIMIAGVAAPIALPEITLAGTLRGLSSGDFKVTGVKRVDPGPLGGVAKCGTGRVASVPVGVCAWADSGSMGVIVFYFETPAQARADFVKIRGAIEKSE